MSLIIVTSIIASGIGPGRRVFTFSPNESIESYFYVGPDEIPSDVILSLEGSSASFIELPSNRITVNESMSKITYYVNFPDSLDEKTYTGGIKVRFVPKDTKLSQITTEVSVVHQVWIKAEIPENITEVNETAIQVIDEVKEKTYDEWILLVILGMVIIILFIAKKSRRKK